MTIRTQRDLFATAHINSLRFSLSRFFGERHVNRQPSHHWPVSWIGDRVVKPRFWIHQSISSVIRLGNFSLSLS